jgi:hypothetical protein
MAMDWDRSGEDSGAAWWHAREERLAGRRGITTGMARGAGEAIPYNDRLDAFASWPAHVDAGRIAVH